MVSALIPSERKLALRNWCQSHGTTPALFALTAFAALVLRWCAAREGVLRCITDGRTHPEVQDTIGFFAAPLYLHVALGACGTFLDLLTHLTHEYCDAYAHADLCYLQSTLPRSEAMRTPVFNWIPSEPKVEPVLLQGSADALACSNVEFDNPLYESFAMDSDPIMLVHDRSEDLAVELLYPRARFSAESMEHFVRCFMSVVDTMLEQPEQMVKGARLTEQG
jgi:non-ribosomal peptide synthetase component F